MNRVEAPQTTDGKRMLWINENKKNKVMDTLSLDDTLKKLERAELRNRVNRLKKHLEEKSEEFCREHGLTPKKGVIYRSTEIHGTIRMAEKE